MLNNNYQLHFYLWDYSPKAWVSNIYVRKAHEDGSPRRFKTIPKAWEDCFGKWHSQDIEDAEGTKFHFSPLYIIRKERGQFKLIIHNRRAGQAFMPCKFYTTFEEAYLAAVESWDSIITELQAEDIKLTDHSEVSHWVSEKSLDNFIKKNKCRNHTITMRYQHKVLLHWEDWEAAV